MSRTTRFKLGIGGLFTVAAALVGFAVATVTVPEIEHAPAGEVESGLRLPLGGERR